MIFSGRPPTKTVLQPTGLSLVVGAGALAFGGNNVQFLPWITFFVVALEPESEATGGVLERCDKTGPKTPNWKIQ